MVYQRIQRGRGLGGFFKPLFSLFRRAAPLLAKTAKNPIIKKIGSEAVKSGLNITADAIGGNNIKNSINKETAAVRGRVSSALKRASTMMDDKNVKKKKIKHAKKINKSSSKSRNKNKKSLGNLF